MSHRRMTIGERIDEWVRRRTLFVFVVLGAVLLSSSLQLLSFGQDLAGWVRDARTDWRVAEYRKLGTLRAGTNVALFEQALGPATFVRQSADGRTEKSFRGRGYWVQTIEDSAGAVSLMAVTACEPEFQPTFHSPIGRAVTLGVSTFAMFGPGQDSEYFLSGATANSRFYDIYALGNPSNYQTAWVGIDDACDWDTAPLYALLQRGNPPLQYSGRTDAAGDVAAAFRVATRMNTYAESAAAPKGTIVAPFQVGVDRILIRTLGGE